MPLTQLFTVCAETLANEEANAADAKSDATLFSFFMILLSREGNRVLFKRSEPVQKLLARPGPRVLTTDRVIVP